MDIATLSSGGVARTATEIRGAIASLEEYIKEKELDLGADSCPVQHFFAPGCYAREITMPEGMVVIGKIHRHAHVNVISHGKVRVLTFEGWQEYTAPCTFVSSPGTKRVVYIVEDTVWTTIHITNETDLAAIEREVIMPDYKELT